MLQKFFKKFILSTVFGTGIGIDFVTYYDKVIRFEYGVNDMGETGLFIHFVAPI